MYFNGPFFRLKRFSFSQNYGSNGINGGFHEDSETVNNKGIGNIL